MKPRGPNGIVASATTDPRLRSTPATHMPETPTPFAAARASARTNPGREARRIDGAVARASAQTTGIRFAARPSAASLETSLARSLKAHPDEAIAPLAGVPYVLQDVFDVAGLPTHCGAGFSEPFDTPAEKSGALHHKLDTLGMVLAAKTAPGEFGIDPVGDFAAPPETDRLPKDAEPDRRQAAPAAGNTARAVAERVVPLGFALDTCCGLRFAAAQLGLFAYRMEPNALAGEGAYPIAPSLDSAGCVTTNAEDLACLLGSLYGAGSRDSVPDEPSGLFITDLGTAPAPSVKAAALRLCRELELEENPGAQKEYGPRLAKAADALPVILARHLYSLHRHWIEEYRGHYHPETLAFIESGAHCTAAEAEMAETAQGHLKEALAQFFRKHDFLMLPASPYPLKPQAEAGARSREAFFRLAAPAALAALPAVTLPVPCGDGTTASIQILPHPRKLYFVPEILAQLVGFFRDGSSRVPE